MAHKTGSETIDGIDFTNWWQPIGTKKYYWPMSGYLTFAAYSPSSISDNATITYNITNGIKFDDYVVNATTNQVDLMLSDKTTDQERPYTSSNQNVGNTKYDGVNIAFKHVLSAISFLVKTKDEYANDDYTVTLKKITIKNAYTQADLTQFEKIEQTTLQLNPTTENTYNIWGDYKTAADNIVYNNTLVLNKTGNRLDSDATSKADILLIPQALNHSATEKVQLEIVYTVSHPDMGSTGEGASAVQNSIEYTKTLDLATSAVASWAAGTRYLYTITIGMNEIHFAPTVTDWVPEIDTPITF